MINTQTLVNFPVFGDNATKAQPDNAKYAAGFQPADVYPAEWVNWVWNKASGGVTALNEGVDMMEREINNVLDGADKTPDATKDNQLLEAIQKLIADAKAQAILAAHPIGSLYWSSQSTDPGTLFGGTWTRIKDKFILAAGDTYTNGNTGGAATVTLTTQQIPSHTHTFTGTEHSHSYTPAGTVSSHKHSVGAHAHGLNSHTHTLSHTHKYTHTHEYTPSGKIASTSGGSDNKTAGMANSTGWFQPSSEMGVIQSNLTTGTVDGTRFKQSSTSIANTIAQNSGRAGYRMELDMSHSHTAYFTGTKGTTSSQSANVTTDQSASTTSQATGNTANSTAFDSGSTEPTFTGTAATLKATAGGSNGNTGGGQSHNNMPPYLVKYCWERVS